MKNVVPHAPRRRQAMLLERLERRLLFDAAQLDPAPQPGRSGAELAAGQTAHDSDPSLDAMGASAASTPLAPTSATTLEQSSSADERQLAFPGAMGFGAYAQGGRGGDVYHVTQLQDHGVGSLRDGINSATGPRTIVFDVSGTIELSSMLIISNPYLTIAGQTAPGDGITLRNYPLAVSKTHDVIIRYMRFRPGDAVVNETDALLVYSSHDVMIDHVSASWGVDENVDTSQSNNVTIQWSVISEGLHDSTHSKGPHSSGSIHTFGAISLHHNLFIHNNWRNPLVLQQADLVNNVIYDWGSHATIAGWSAPTPDIGPTQVNLQNNYYIAGPSTVNPLLTYLGHRNSQLWLDGNLLDANRNGVLDGSPLTLLTGWSEVLTTRLDYPTTGTEDALTAYHRVLDDAGASLVRDAVDQRLVRDVIDQTGSVINSTSQVGGWPELAVLRCRPTATRTACRTRGKTRTLISTRSIRPTAAPPAASRG